MLWSSLLVLIVLLNTHMDTQTHTHTHTPFRRLTLARCLTGATLPRAEPDGRGLCLLRGSCSRSRLNKLLALCPDLENWLGCAVHNLKDGTLFSLSINSDLYLGVISIRNTNYCMLKYNEFQNTVWVIIFQ